MVSAIEKEIASRSATHRHTTETIYFGGGTPSILNPREIDTLLQAVVQHYPVAAHPEITLEANPDDIDNNKAAAWKAIGINRFSIGIQSFDDRQLQWMNRAHDSRQSTACIDTIRKAGFDNFSIDLIYGTPGQNQRGWENDLQQAIRLGIPHLSCYAMTVEDKTALKALIQKGAKKAPLDEELADRFSALMRMTREAGYHHYEISNFALPGKESKHNSAYWEGKAYLGFGPSAHSFDGASRSWNTANNMKYMQAIENGLPFSEKEVLTELDMLNEYIMTALRSSKGIIKSHVREKWGQVLFGTIEKEILPHIESGSILNSGSSWTLTDKSKFFADGIASSLFQLKN